MSRRFSLEEAEELFGELSAFYERQLIASARRILPHLTADDLLQPNDFPELENHPEFRYEEGVLAGIKTGRMAISARMKNDP